MDYKTLTPAVQALLTAHPEWTDQQVADALNTADQTVPCTRWVSMRTLASELTPTEYLTIKGVLAAASQDPNIGPLIADVAKWMQNVGTADDTGVDFGRDASRAMIDQLFTGDLAPLATKLKALAEKQVSTAEKLGLPFVSGGDVAYARTYEPGMG